MVKKADFQTITKYVAISQTKVYRPYLYHLYWYFKGNVHMKMVKKNIYFTYVSENYVLISKIICFICQGLTSVQLLITAVIWL